VCVMVDLAVGVSDACDSKAVFADLA
jgi:hypothetical protein